MAKGGEKAILRLARQFGRLLLSTQFFLLLLSTSYIACDPGRAGHATFAVENRGNGYRHVYLLAIFAAAFRLEGRYSLATPDAF